MINTLLSFSTSFIKITLVVSLVGFSLLGANFDQMQTGAFLTSTITAANNIIGSEDFPDTCTEGERWLATVESSTQGLRKNGTPITDPNRTNPDETLGSNDATTTSNFFSLGNDGIVVASFDTPVEDGSGNDFSLYETTNGRATYPIETATVEVSQDGINWVMMLTPASSRPTGINSYDLTTIGVPWFQYIRITDTTDFGPHAADADGFDVDAVSANYGSCDDDLDQGRTISGLKFHDENENGALDSGEDGLSGWTIYATASSSGDLSSAIASASTDSVGNYAFTIPLSSQTHYIREVLQPDWNQTLPGAPDYYSTVVTDGDITRNFGNVPVVPTGNLQITKYVCAQDETITTAQRPDVNGSFTVPDNCELEEGARFGYIFQEDKTDLSPPYPGLTDSTPFTPFGGTTNVSGVLLTTVIPSDGRYMLAELDGAGNRIADDQLLGFLCTGDNGLFTNNYEATFVPEDGTAYCAVFNRDPDTSIVLNEFLPNPQGADDAAMPGGEWVELYNNSAFDIDVNGWVLYDSTNTSALTISTSNSDNNGNPFDSGETVVPAGAWLVVYRDGNVSFDLNEGVGGDSVRLYNAPLATGDLIDQHTYADPVAEEKTMARMPDGTGSWVDPIAQPGRENISDINDTDLDPFVKIWQQDSNNAIIGLFEGIEHSSADYTVTYTRNTGTVPIQEQLMGTITIDNNNLYLFDIFLGTESSGGAQTPHTDISNVQLDVLFHDNGMPTREANLGSWTP